MLPRPSVWEPPSVPTNGPRGALLVELVIYSGSPFRDTWAYFVQSSFQPSVGVLIRAASEVGLGINLEIERNYDFDTASAIPVSRIPLQWIDAKFVDERAMLNYGDYAMDSLPVCRFEESLNKTKAPQQRYSNAVDDKVCFLLFQKKKFLWVLR